MSLDLLIAKQQKLQKQISHLENIANKQLLTHDEIYKWRLHLSYIAESAFEDVSDVFKDIVYFEEPEGKTKFTRLASKAYVYTKASIATLYAGLCYVPIVVLESLYAIPEVVVGKIRESNGERYNKRITKAKTKLAELYRELDQVKYQIKQITVGVPNTNVDLEK